MQIVFGLLAVIVAALGYRAVQALNTVKSYREYWRQQNNLPVAQGSFRLLVLGDSVAQGVGASTISATFAMLAAGYINQVTGRQVTISNLSVTGATVRDVLDKQLPTASLVASNLIIVIASANDALKSTPLEVYENNLKQLLVCLPPEKTLLADVPWVRRRSRYVPILHRLADEAGFTVVSHDVSTPKARWPFMYVAGDFLHPNDRGYKDIWLKSFKPHIADYLQQLKAGA